MRTYLRKSELSRRASWKPLFPPITLLFGTRKVYREDQMAVVVAYMVIEGTTKEELENLVKVAIGKGWQPLGGVAIAGRFFYQAMVGR
jgi:hypothetical protein